MLKYHIRTKVVSCAGRVFTILRKEEISNTYVKDHKLPLQLLEAARPASEHALEVLQAYLQAENF